MMVAKIIVGLIFGDEGKGLSADYLCSQNSSKSKIVVRYTGGQQAGHGTERNGIKHSFSNYGSGSLLDVPTYFTEHCTMYPPTLYKERLQLEEKGVQPSVFHHPLCKVTTPYDLIFNRIIEKTNNHGSVGVGIGTTMSRHEKTGHKLFVIDLKNPILLKPKLEQIKCFYRDQLYGIQDKKQFDEMCIEEEKLFFDALESIQISTMPYVFLLAFDEMIFEGAQGILLDKDHGIFPNVTYGNTTSKNALEVCETLGIQDDNIEFYYITRCYQTRHGNGWMSDEKDIGLINTETENNTHNEWQGDFRIGELDYDLLNYSLDIDRLYSSNSNPFFKRKRNLIVTCLDQRPDFKFDRYKLNMEFDGYYESFGPEGKDVKKIK